MNDNPHGYPGPYGDSWRGNSPNILSHRVQSWSHGSRRSASSGEEILSTAIGWWDSSYYRKGDRFLRNQGVAGDLINLRLGSADVANSNDPLFLPVESEGYMYLPGVSGNYASAPDSAALSITGDIDIKVCVALTDWTPTSDSGMVHKWTGTGDQRSYGLLVTTTGLLRLRISQDGVALINIDSTVATGISDGDTKWIRATLDVDDGSGNRVTKFYTSDDGVAWTQLGTTVTTAGTVAIFDGTALLEVGTSTSGIANISTATFYRTIIQSAYDTANNTDSLVFDADFTNLAANTTSFTERPEVPGATVTINRSTTGRKTVIMPPRSLGGRSCFLMGSDDYFEQPLSQFSRGPQNRILQLQDYIGTPAPDITLFYAVRYWHTNAHSVIDRNQTGPGSIGSSNTGTTFGAQLGVVRITIRGGVQTTSVSGPAYTAGAMTCGVSTLAARNSLLGNRRTFTNGVSGTTNTTFLGDYVFPTYPYYSFRIGASSVVTETPLDGEFYAAAIFHRILTQDQINAVCRHYGAI